MINENCQKFLNDLDEQLRFLNLEMDNSIQVAENAITIVLKSIEKLKSFILKHKFKDQFEEIYFFKKLKPQFLAKLIYYNRIYIIETHKPHGGEKILKKYLNSELLNLKQYFDTNLEFYRYFRTGSDYLDHKYFVRGKHDIKLRLDSFYFETDHRFCTSHDFKIAKIISNDQVQVYLESELAQLERKELKQQSVQNKNEPVKQSPFTWTASKVSLIELIYALQTQGVFNNKSADIKDIAAFFETTFNIELGDYYRTFLELRMRKTDRTKFLTSLTQSLIERMDEADEK